MSTENYVYQLEVNWSLLTEGLTLPVDYQVVFGQIMGRYMKKGQSKPIKIFLNGKTFDAKITNVKFDEKFKRKSDVLQIRYPRNGELARELQAIFPSSYNFIKAGRDNREPGSRKSIKLPEDCREYLAIYTTEYDDTYIFEPIVSDDIAVFKESIVGVNERQIETFFDYDITDDDATVIEKKRIQRIRKLNRKIGENLKLLYGYKCQICGKQIGEEFGTHIAEAHHIEYFSRSWNNNIDNQLVVCPNHHSIIHDMDPVFDRNRKLYLYSNGVEQRLELNVHL